MAKTIVEKKEELSNLEIEKKKMYEKVSNINLKIQSAEEVDKARELSDELNSYQTALKGLMTDINKLEKEIIKEEAQLKTLADTAAKQLQENKIYSLTTKTEYLDSKEAMKDYARILQKNAGMNGNDVQKAWENHLIEKGITNIDVILPTPVITAIKDAFAAPGTIWNSVKHIYGVYQWENAFNDSTDTAKGHKDGNEKKEQNINFVKRLIVAQYIYKYIQVPKRFSVMSEDVLIAYILQELPMHVVRMLEKAIVLGDGLETSDVDKITSFTPMAKDIETYNTNFQASDYTNLFDAILKMYGSVEATGEKYLVMNSMTYVEFKTQKDSTGKYIDPMTLDASGAKSIVGIPVITADWMPNYMNATDTDVTAVLYSGNAYEAIGDNVIEQHRNFLLQKNSEEFLAEIYAGGALTMYKGAATLLGKVSEPATP